MTYDEMIEKTNLVNRINDLCDKFKNSRSLKKMIKNMNIDQLEKCEIMLISKLYSQQNMLAFFLINKNKNNDKN